MAFQYKRVSNIINLFTDEVFDNVTTSANSAEVPTRRATHFGLFLKILSAGSPTDIVFEVQFSNDGGTTWFVLDNWFWGDLRYSDLAVATVIHEILDGPCSGRLFRLRAIGAGTAVADTFTFSAWLELYR